MISLTSFSISTVACSLFFISRRMALPCFSSSGPMRTASSMPLRSASDSALETLRPMSSISAVIFASRSVAAISRALGFISFFIGMMTMCLCF